MILRIGVKSDYVKQVQTKLGLMATGTFDIETSDAVKRWQAEYGLPVDGMVDGATWKSMFG